VIANAALRAHPLSRVPVERFRLANGLRVVVQPDPSWPIITSMVCYDAGSRRDPFGRAGLAHLCEHLAFDGPRHSANGTFPTRIEAVGGSAQARTMTDRLCFSATFPARHLDAVLAVEAERMAEPLDPQDGEALDIQRLVLIDELRQRSRSRRRGTAFEHVHRQLYPERHPYHTPPAGDPAGIEAITCDDVTAFVASYFSPASAVMVLVGDVSVVEAVRRVRDAFKALPGGATPPPDPGSFPPARRDHTAARVPAVVSTTDVYVAWAVPGFGHDAWYLASLLERGLSGGRSSPLARVLVDGSGLAQDIRGALVSMRDSSTLVIGATAARGVSRERLERGLLEATSNVLACGLTEASVRRARKKALSDHFGAVEDIERRADLCASMVCYLDAPERLEDEPLRYLGPDRDAIAAFAARLDRDMPHVVVSLVPVAEAQ
jgi:predicted Zn-dependent peptidase